MSAVHRGASSPAPELAWAVAGIEHVSLETLAQAAAGTGLPGLSPREQRWAQVYAARALIVREPNYARVAARLLLDIVYHEALGLEMRGGAPGLR